MIGARIGLYEITAKLGEGGMGEVYRARDTRLGRDVALKVLPAELADDPERRARFEREAKTLAALNHPHIATLYGIEHLGDQHVLVMELVEGEDLAQRLTRGPIAIEEAIPIAVQVAEALEAAHERGIIHRDLKPANVKVRQDGTVKVLDFGIAKALAADGGIPGGDPALSPTVTRGTELGVILGTAAYMAPEQARSQLVDRRADIWAFAVLLFEMLTGRRLFHGETVSDTLAAVLRQEVDLTPLPQETPPALRRVLRRCLERDPRRRLRDIGDARLELADALTAPEPAIAAPEPGPARSSARERIAWGLAVLAVAAALALAVLVPRRTTAPAFVKRFTMAPPASGGFESGIALSRDGSQLAFVAPSPEGEDVLWVRSLSALAPRALAGTEGASFPFWSPDGRRLAFFAKGKLKTIDPAGGTPQSLCAAPNPRGGAWSQDGVLLLSINAGGSLVTVPAGGGAPSPVVGSAGPGEPGLLRFPSFLPDGRRFLFYRLAGAPKQGIWLGSLDEPAQTFLVAGDSGAVYATSGFLVYRAGARLVAQRFDLEKADLVGPATPVGEDVWWDMTATFLSAFALSENGVLAYRTGGVVRSRLQWFDRSGTPLGALGPPGNYLEPAISPDARRVAVSLGAEDELGTNIWILDAERGGMTRLTFPPELTTTPLWSPDGRHILYSVFPTGEIIRKDSGGAGKGEMVLKTASFSPLDDWSSDGRTLFFEILDFRTFSFDIGRVMFQGDRRPEPLLTGPYTEVGARLSPDGKLLAYESDESGVPEVFVRSYPDLAERFQISTAGGNQPRWRADGRELFFVAPDRKIMAAEISASPRFSATTPHALFQTSILPLVEARNHYDVTPDGRRFLVNSRRPEDATASIVIVLDWQAELATP